MAAKQMKFDTDARAEIATGLSQLARAVKDVQALVLGGFGLTQEGTVKSASGWLIAGRPLPALGWSPQGPRLTRRFGVMDLVRAGALLAHPALSRLGPEPLSTPERSFVHGEAACLQR